jgi:uncharacterized protein YraI
MSIDEYGQVHRHTVRTVLILVAVVIGVIWFISGISQKPQQTTASEPATPAATVPVIYATVRQDLNMRSGPGVKYTIVQIIRRDARVEVVDNSGPWLKIRYNGKEGFSDRDYLRIDNSPTQVPKSNYQSQATPPSYTELPRSSSTAASSNPSVRIKNNTGYLVYYVYLVPNSAQYWGDDKLGSSTLPNGSSVTLPLPYSAVDRYSILLKDSDGDFYRKRDIPINNNQTIIFTFDDLYQK